jgi:hypothetical protein
MKTKAIKIESTSENVVEKDIAMLKKAVARIVKENSELKKQVIERDETIRVINERVSFLVSEMSKTPAIVETLEEGKIYSKKIKQIVSIGVPYTYQETEFVEYKVKLEGHANEVYRFVTLSDKVVREDYRIEFTADRENRLKKARVFV